MRPSSHRHQERRKNPIGKQRSSKQQMLKRWPYHCISLCLFVLPCFGDSRAAALNARLSPIPNFGPSWVASAAHGTSIAIRCSFNQTEFPDCSDALLLILRSSSLSRSPREEAVPSTLELDGIRIIEPTYHSSDELTWHKLSRRWTFLGSTALCSMTGFSLDVDYLTRFLQKVVDDCRSVLESTSAVRSIPLSTLQIVQSLAEEVQEAGQWQGGRPFGIQALLIGKDYTAENAASLGLYTIDPSGSYRSWRGGTAIGRNAKVAREKIYEYWKSSHRKLSSSPLSALFVGLRASVLSRKEESEAIERTDQYEALLIWLTKDQLNVALIDPKHIAETRESVLSESTSDDEMVERNLTAN
jgi:20S proteasome alpha/beta subunit